MRTLAFLAITAASLASCVKTNAFKCDNNADCTGNGAQCEVDGFCSIASADCTSGHQYSDTAGDLANKCVGGDPGPDGQLPDGPTPDGDPPDGPLPDAPKGCDPDFVAITGGNTGHKYKLINTTDTWSNQHNNNCLPSSYLAIPDDAAELGALFTLAAQNDIWVGVSDIAVEGVFRDVLGNVYTALIPGGNKANEDCVQTNNGTSLDVIACNSTRRAVCECEE